MQEDILTGPGHRQNPSGAERRIRADSSRKGGEIEGIRE